MSQNLITLLDLCNNVSRGIWTKQRHLQRRRTTASQRRDTKHEHSQGKVGSKLRETLIRNITRLLKRFHGFASSWNLLNQRTKRCCVFTAARCDNKATKCTWLGRVSKTARVTLKITKHEIPRKSKTRAETNRKGDTLQLTLQTWS